MEKPYKRALLLSGGGTRLALYGGVLMALEEAHLKPDLVIASCGGAFTSVVINAFQDNRQRKAFFQSKEYFHFVTHTKLTHHRKLHKIGWYAYLKKLNQKKAPWIEDIFERYLLDAPQNLSELLPSLAHAQFDDAIATIMIGAKILFDKDEVGQKRGTKKLFQKVLLTSEKIAQNIDIEKLKLAQKIDSQSAVSSEILIKTDMPMLYASRASVSDMFYVAPLAFQEEHFLGGVIDLVPFEVANLLAEELILERKQSYTSLEEGLIRATFGFSANNRLNEVEKQKVDYWIDTRDAPKALRGFYPQKAIDWAKFEVSLSLPPNYEKFQEDIEKQWHYGYQKTLESIYK